MVVARPLYSHPAHFVRLAINILLYYRFFELDTPSLSLVNILSDISLRYEGTIYLRSSKSEQRSSK